MRPASGHLPTSGRGGFPYTWGGWTSSTTASRARSRTARGPSSNGCAAEPGHRHLWLAAERHAAAFPPGVDSVPYGSPGGGPWRSRPLTSSSRTPTRTSSGARARTRCTCRSGTARRSSASTGTSCGARRACSTGCSATSTAGTSWCPRTRPAPPRLRQAFRWEGEVLEIGYPRNDVLNAPDRDERRARMREQLGIPEGTTAVLYTPTFRDDAVFAERSFELALDSNAFTAALGADHVLLLRLHYMVTEELPPAGHPAPCATSPCTPTSASSTSLPTCSSPTTRRRCSTSRSPAGRWRS